MLRFLHPSGWWVLTTLALPLVLHLWRPPARTVRLGSLRFLEGLPRRNLRNLRWRETLLLLTRLLLLAFLAVLLTAPRWTSRTSQAPRRWVLVSMGASIEGTNLERLRTLQNTGWEIRRFTDDFPLVDLASIVGGRVGDASSDFPDIWSLLREADRILPAHSKIALFCEGEVCELQGVRPTLQHCQVEWVQTPTSEQTGHPWIASLRQSGSGDAVRLNLDIGSSSATVTRFFSQELPARLGRVPLAGVVGHWEVELAHGGKEPFSARLINGGKPEGAWVTTRTAAQLAVSILHDTDRSEDARYVEAAVRTIAQADGRDVAVTTRQTDQVDDAGTHLDSRWIVWLSSRPVPKSLARKITEGKILITDAATSTSAPDPESWIIAATNLDRWSPSPGKIGLHRRSDPLDAAATVWTDGFGRPLLTWSPLGQGGRWQFLGRFHPSWNDLPRSGALPEALGFLFDGSVPGQSAPAPRDWRIAGADQMTPKTSEDGAVKSAFPPVGDHLDLSPYLWAATLLCFCVERLLSSLPVTRSTPTLPVRTATAGSVEAVRR